MNASELRRTPSPMRAFRPPRLPLLVFTDLDGTLLDHDDYGFSPALPALAQLRDFGIPLIPNSSKTLAELAELNVRLDNGHPCIAENGGALCLPVGYLPDDACGERRLGYQVHRLAPDYDSVLGVLHHLRNTFGFRFRGFSDMSVEAIAEHTGLDVPSAALASQRLCSEPLIWDDDAVALEAFREQLALAGLRLTRGGRYWHVMGPSDKASAMGLLCDRYRAAGFDGFTTVALGDSPNDAEMLGAADVAVIIPRKDGGVLECQGRRQTLLAPLPGPAGWNSTMLQLLDRSAATLPADAG